MCWVYRVAGISRQGYNKKRKEDKHRQDVIEEVIKQGQKIRGKHRKMGCRRMSKPIQKKVFIGQNQIEQILLMSGFRIQKKKSKIRTTLSMKDKYHKNLIEGKVLDNINQVWQSDITYLYVGSTLYFVVFIIDVYSRRIIGYAVAKHMRAELCLKCLKMALRLRGISDYLLQLIHHSDRGVQYGSHAYGKVLDQHGIAKSMCLEAWQNAYAERLNRTMKSEYLEFIPKSFVGNIHQQLKKMVKLYNEERPHTSLNGMTPVEFEKSCSQLTKEERPRVKLYTKVTPPKSGASSPLPLETQGSSLP